MNISYPAFFEEQCEGGYCVRFPDFPEAFTEGDTLDEALFNASEVLTLTLDGRLEEGMPIPSPTAKLKGVTMISPDAKTQAALLLRQARGTRPLSDIAAALGTSWPAAQRLEDPSHWPSLRQLDRAARACGHRLVLSLE